jgi:hypothetical protein
MTAIGFHSFALPNLNLQAAIAAVARLDAAPA